jgi:hypothetical protein
MRGCLHYLSLMLTLGLVVVAQAQPPASPSYQVRLRFKIDADLQQRYRDYKAMVARLNAVGFVATPGLPRAELYGDTLAGTLPASGFSTLRLERQLRTALLVPAGYQLPADAEKTVLVRLELALTGPDRQKELNDKARDQLKPLGLVENEGYDHQNFTRILGRLPVPALDMLLSDKIEVALPSSFKTVTVSTVKAPLVRLAIVIAEPTPPATDVARPTPAPADKQYLDKISPDLKTLLAKMPEGDLKKLMQVELVLRDSSLSESLRGQLLRSETLYLTEGSFGPIVSGLASPERLALLAQQPEISTVRLPQTVRSPARTNETAFEFLPLGRDLLPLAKITPVAFHPNKAKKAVIIGDDFRGYEKLLGESLPRNTKLIDITSELNPDFTPHAATTGNDLGLSARLASAFLAKHPHDQVVLVRMDPSTPYQVQQIGEAILGRPWLTPALLARNAEFADEGSRIETEKVELRVIRQLLQRDFTIDEATIAKRENYKKKQEALVVKEKLHFEKGKRFDAFMDQIKLLNGAITSALTLQWVDGYADLPGSNPHVRFLSNDVLRGSAWYQAISLRPGQVWTGLFRDSNHDNAMEFTSNKSVDRPDLAFLSWNDNTAGKQTLLPEGAVVQVTLNWFEVHALGEADNHRKPLTNLNINVLKQRDPSGKTLPVDAFEVIARSPVLADRVEHGARGSHYQSILRFTVPAGGGRYALQLTGTLPASTGDGVTERAEVHPKLSLEVVDPSKRAAGRVVFESFATTE